MYFSVALILLLAVGASKGLDSHQEKCSIQEGNGIRLDTCDASKTLTCQAGRCMCQDVGNQLYDYRYIQTTLSRTRRSPKKGGGGGKSKGGGGNAKAAVVGIAAGAAGAYGGYQLGKAVSNSDNSPNGQYNSNSNKKQNLKKEYACYGRVGSPCMLNYNNINVVPLNINSTSTTTAAPTTLLTDRSNVTNTNDTSATTTEVPNNITSSITTTNPVPVTLAQISTDAPKYPLCVRNAICMRPSNFANVGNNVFKTDGDPRIGACVCAEGYKPTNTDQCVKSGASSSTSFGISSTLSVICFVFSLTIFS